MCVFVYNGKFQIIFKKLLHLKLKLLILLYKDFYTSVLWAAADSETTIW